EIAQMGCPTTVVQRRDLSGVTVTLNGLDANAIDTLVVLSFDHFSTGQVPDPAEVDWLQRFLQDPRKCAVLCPHHDIGAEEEYETKVKEFLHHGDPLEPPQDRVGGYARTLLADLGYPIEGRYGLKAAANRNTSPIEPAPLKLGPAPDTKKILRDVYT